MFLAEVTQVEPEVFSEIARDAEPALDLVHHVSRHDVATRELLLFRLRVDHEAVAVLVQEEAAVAAAALGHEDATRHESGRMELDCLHVAEGDLSRFEREHGAGALIDRGVRRVLPVDPTVAAARTVDFASQAVSSPVRRHRETRQHRRPRGSASWLRPDRARGSRVGRLSADGV